MGLSRINRELQFEVCNHVSHMQLPMCQGKEGMFLEGERKLGGFIGNKYSRLFVARWEESLPFEFHHCHRA